MVHKDRKATWGPESQAWKRSVVLAPLGGTGLVLREGQLSRPQIGVRQMIRRLSENLMRQTSIGLGRVLRAQERV